MKNLTIVLDEDVARWARVWAARHDTSVSRMVGTMLEEKMAEEQNYEALKAVFLSREPRRLGSRTGSLPTRDELHER